MSLAVALGLALALPAAATESGMPGDATIEAAGNSVAADVVAMIVTATGEVVVERAADGATEPAGAGTRLMAGDRVVIGDGGSAVVLYLTGRRATLTATTTIQAPEQAERAGVFERTVATLDAVASTDARQHPNRQGMIRPIAGAPVPTMPRNGIAVLSVRPTFTWMSVPGATGYTIQIRSADGPMRRRFQTGSIDTVWTLPATESPLVPGLEYRWTVAPAGNGRVASERAFRVANSEQVQAVQDGLADIAAVGLDPWSDGLFLSALVFRDAGLLYEAARALDAMERQSAAGGRPYFVLRGEVLDAMGMLDAAARAFDHADRLASETGMDPGSTGGS